MYGVMWGCGVGVFLILAIDKISKLGEAALFSACRGYSPRVPQGPRTGRNSFHRTRVARVAEATSGQTVGRGSCRLCDGPAIQPDPVLLLNVASNGSIQSRLSTVPADANFNSFNVTGGPAAKDHRCNESRPGEGKTTVVSNMAIAIAESGRKVLVIDADLRRPRIHTIFGVEKKKVSPI